MFVTTNPAAMLAANSGLQAIGASMMSSNAAVAEPTTAVMSPASDPTSVYTGAFFSLHGGMYQAVAGVAAAVHELMVGTLASSAGSYAATEAINAVAAT